MGFKIITWVAKANQQIVSAPKRILPKPASANHCQRQVFEVTVFARFIDGVGLRK